VFVHVDYVAGERGNSTPGAIVRARTPNREEASREITPPVITSDSGGDPFKLWPAQTRTLGSKGVHPIKPIEEFWKLTTKPETADTRLSDLPIVIISRPTLQKFFRELREAIGPDVDRLLYRCGIETGQGFVATMVEWTGSKDPMDIVEGLGDIYALCGWFATESMQVDPVTHQARIRLSRSLETYGIEGRFDAPACHFLRGYFAGFFRSLFWSDEVECQETSCRGKGDKVCEFVVTNSAGP